MKQKSSMADFVEDCQFFWVIIQELLFAHKVLKCNMFLEIHFLDSHFSKNLGAVLDKHDKRFTDTAELELL